MNTGRQWVEEVSLDKVVRKDLSENMTFESIIEMKE